MPEGPEIRRAADSLEAAIKGKPLTDVWFAFPQLKSFESRLIGEKVTHLETRGKALLTHFSNQLTLYSHNQLYGVWRVVETVRSRRPRGCCALNYRPQIKPFCSTAPQILRC